MRKMRKRRKRKGMMRGEDYWKGMGIHRRGKKDGGEKRMFGVMMRRKYFKCNVESTLESSPKN
jgi:hypothetical protein